MRKNPELTNSGHNERSLFPEWLVIVALAALSLPLLAFIAVVTYMLFFSDPAHEVAATKAQNAQLMSEINTVLCEQHQDQEACDELGR